MTITQSKFQASILAFLQFSAIEWKVSNELHAGQERDRNAECILLRSCQKWKSWQIKTKEGEYR
jgi:hypothetical protein